MSEVLESMLDLERLNKQELELNRSKFDAESDNNERELCNNESKTLKIQTNKTEFDDCDTNRMEFKENGHSGFNTETYKQNTKPLCVSPVQMDNSVSSGLELGHYYCPELIPRRMETL
jgi:hypothetical protein